MALILRTFGQRCFLKRCLPNTHLRFVPIATSTIVKRKPEENFFKKNERLERPISPYMIYAPQITWLLSISHRITGMVLSGAATSLAVGMLLWPGNFDTYLQWVQSFQFGPQCIFAAKFSLAFPFMFHLANGVRHLFWDIGQGFDLKSVTMTGYTVLIISTVTSVMLASM